MPARRRAKIDPPVDARRELARQPVSPELAIVVRASGYKGEIPNALWALEWLGFLAGHRAEAIDRERAEGNRGQ